MAPRRFVFMSFLLGLLPLLAGMAAYAGTFTVFGPEDFVRSAGNPIELTRTFPAAVPGAGYTLHIDNGGAHQQFGRVTSATVKLDGAVIAGPSAFNQSVRTIDKPITLAAQNTLKIALQGSPGSGFTVTILGLDGQPPVVQFLSPAEGSFLPSSRPTITASYVDAGSGVDAQSVQFLLDGIDRTSAATVNGSALLFEPSSPLAEGVHTASLRLRDLSGNESQATIRFTTDSAPPSLAIVEPTSSVLSDQTTTPVRVTYADPVSGIDLPTLLIEVDGSDLEPSCSVAPGAAACHSAELSAGLHTVIARLRDRAGNLGTATFSFEVDLDKAIPSLAITSPSSSLIQGNSSPAIRVEYSDARSGVDLTSLRILADAADLTASCQVDPAEATCIPPPLERGPHTITAQIADHRGNVATASAEFAVVFPLEIAITEPIPDALTAVASVRVVGTVSPQARSVTVSGVAAEISGGTFQIDTLGLHDGVNELVAVAEDAFGNVGTASVRVIADTTPPNVGVTFPTEGATVSTPAITVTGLVNDLTIGTVSETHVTVTINGVPARVENRSFVADGIPLQQGSNTLTVVATDRAGNRATTEVQVSLEERTGVPSLQIVSGDGQVGPISMLLPEPLVVGVSDATGQPLRDVQVVFRVVRGNGVLANGEQTAVAQTDLQGRAPMPWTLGSRAGVGVDRVRATAVGIAGEVSFIATAQTAVPAAIHVASGDNQRGIVGDKLARPLVAVVTDAGHNPLSGIPVSFRIVDGGGGFAEVGGADVAAVETDESGLATVRLTLGPSSGLDNNRVEATFAELSTLPAGFKASAFLPGDPSQTLISGVVLDNQGAPVPGVTMRLRDSGVTAMTDAEGQFRLAGVPVGQVFLIADATTATRPGSWASLEYELFTLPGVDNTLPRPIYILPLDLPNGVFVDETRGGTVRLPEVPGFALEIAPGSVTFPGGSRSGVVSVTAVHADRIPMPPGAGMQPRLIVTIQPAGAHFDPPAPITLPNVDGLVPGTVTELFSFDHDISEWVSIGTGTVSDDGLVVRSDPGIGILEAGWHCGAPPSGRGLAARLAVRITTKRPLYLANRNPQLQKQIEANGGPQRDTVYSWETADQTIVSLSPSSSDCVNSSSCVTATANRPGSTQVTATITCTTCTTTNNTESDAIDVHVVGARIVEAFSEQLPGRECNRFPTRVELNHPDKNVPMLMGGVGGSTARVSMRTMIDPPSALDKVRVGVRKKGTAEILGEAVAIAAPAKAVVEFEATPGLNLYEFVIGLDENGDNHLQSEEVQHSYPDEVRVITASDYSKAKLAVKQQGQQLFGIAQHLSEFFLAETETIDIPNVIHGVAKIDLATPALVHPLGAEWSQECGVQVPRLTFTNSSEISRQIAETPAVENLVKKELARHREAIVAFFQNPNSETTAVFPADLGENEPWRLEDGVSYRDWGIDTRALEITTAFGSVYLEVKILAVEVEKSTLNVISIIYEGHFDDIYDFDFTDWRYRDGATVQGGHPSLGDAGRIFLNTVKFRREATRDLFGGFRFTFPRN